MPTSNRAVGEVVLRLRTHVREFGVLGAFRMLYAFATADADRSGALDAAELDAALRRFGFFAARDELQLMINTFTTYSELLACVTGQLTEARARVVAQWWAVLNPRDAAFVPTERIAASIVFAGKKLDLALDASHVYLSLSELVGGTGEAIPHDAFLRFCDGVSMCVPDDATFGNFVAAAASGAAGPSQQTPTGFSKTGSLRGSQCLIDTSALNRSSVFGTAQSGLSDDAIARVVAALKAKMYEHARANETPGQALMRAFRFLDADDSGAISPSELARALETLGLPLSAPEVEDLFAYFDLNKNGRIEYAEFVKRLDPSTPVSGLRPGTLVWICGAPGAGTHTIARKLVAEISSRAFESVTYVAPSTTSVHTDDADLYRELPASDFEYASRTGAFAFEWVGPLGKCGLGSDVIAALDAGRHVVTIGALSAAAAARRAFPTLVVLHVRADDAERKRRLMRKYGSADVVSRLLRVPAELPPRFDSPVRELVNSDSASDTTSARLRVLVQAVVA